MVKDDDAVDFLCFPGSPGLSPPAASRTGLHGGTQTSTLHLHHPDLGQHRWKRKRKWQKSSTLAQAPGEHTGNEITD